MLGEEDESLGMSFSLISGEEEVEEMVEKLTGDILR
jgi:hypothetical protein